MKSAKSGKIQRFFGKELLEIHCNPPDPTIFLIFCRRATWNPPDLARSSPDSMDLARSWPIWRNIGIGFKTRNRLTTYPKLTDLNRMIRPLIWVGFGFDFHPPKKFRLGLGQAQTWPSLTRKHPYWARCKHTQNTFCNNRKTQTSFFPLLQNTQEFACIDANTELINTILVLPKICA